MVWILVYVVVIVQGWMEQSYGIPILAICLNAAWEWRFAVDQPREHPEPPMPATTRWILWVWLLLDGIIVLQVFLFGRDYQSNPLLRQYYYLVVPLMILSAYVLHTLMHETFDLNLQDYFGVLSAYLNNLVMSALFIPMFFARPELHGLSVWVAVGKLAGTGLTSLGILVQDFSDSESRRSSDPTARAPLASNKFVSWRTYLNYFLFAAVFILDAVYLVLFLQ